MPGSVTTHRSEGSDILAIHISVPGGSFSSCLKPAHRKDEGNGHKREPADDPKAIHESQECALANQLLVDHAERGGTGICAGKSVSHELRNQGVATLLQSLGTAPQVRTEKRLVQVLTTVVRGSEEGNPKASAPVSEEMILTGTRNRP